MEIKRINKERIIEELREKGYTGKPISYKEIQRIYEEYGYGMSEVDFAQIILGVSYGNYMNCKHNGTNVRVLKEKRCTNVDVGEDEKRELSQEEIIEILTEKGYFGKPISYEELQKLYEKYGNGMSEVDFAQIILGISYNNYMACKNSGKDVCVLKKEELPLTPEEVQEIRKHLKKQGYAGKFIYYEELHKLYEEYGNGMNELDFAQIILGISYSCYTKCKSRGTRTKCLKSEKKKDQEIIESLKEKGYVCRRITYAELQELHKEYGNGMTEVEFARRILKISNYHRFKKKSRFNNEKRLNNEKVPTIEILKDEKRELSQEEIQKIVESLKEKGYLGKSIPYEELHKLYGEYGNGMSEVDFARIILGISYGNYMNCKNKGTNVIVKDSIVQANVKEISRLHLEKADWYSKEFINDICKEYNITFEEFISYFYGFKRFDVNDDILEWLKGKEKIWIGKIRLSEEFANENIDIILKVATDVLKSLMKYRKKETEDLKQDVITYIIENMGQVERNFGQNLTLFQTIIYSSARRYCEHKILNELRISRKYLSSSLTRRNRENEEYVVEIPDENADVEKEVSEETVTENFIMESDRCIQLLSKYIEAGYDRSKAIKITAEEMSIDANTMLKYMQQYLLTNGKVVIRRNGNVEWGIK